MASSIAWIFVCILLIDDQLIVFIYCLFILVITLEIGTNRIRGYLYDVPAIELSERSDLCEICKRQKHTLLFISFLLNILLNIIYYFLYDFYTNY
jgi:hypothetical protein